jgi:hypothetical protein
MESTVIGSCYVRAKVPGWRWWHYSSMVFMSPYSSRLGARIILFKTGYFVALLVALLLWSASEKEGMLIHSSGEPWSSVEGLALRQHFLSWNAKFYLFLSKKGYERGLNECAFYPLYPLLIRWASKVTGCDSFVMGIALSNVSSLLAFLVFFGITARRFGETAAALALTLLLAFPGSLFFQFIYTESLFFLLLMLFCLALEREQLALALVTAFLMPLTRAVGIFCVFPLLWHLFFRSPPAWWFRLISRQGGAGWIARFVGPRGGQSPQVKSADWGRASAICLVLAPFFGWATYFLLMWKWTGNAFEGIEAQKYYGVQSIHNLFDPVRFVTQFFNPTDWHAFRGSLLDRCIFILLIDCFPLIWKLDKGWCIWAFFLGVVPAVSGGFTSYMRFASVVFPLFIALGVYLSKPGMRWWRWLVLTTFITSHLVLVWRFVNFKWAG